MRTHEVEVHKDSNESWRVTVVDTGLETMTGGRLKRVRDYIGDQTFMLTYGDGVADVDISALVEYHAAQGKLATLTAVQTLGRFGALEFDHLGGVLAFREKPLGDGQWINGGFFVMEPSVIDRIDGDETVLEREPLQSLGADGQLAAFKHSGFWQPMDTLRDKRLLDELWAAGSAPWQTW
jgi:glucose-1-phosphate cytidylyltransferase